MSEIALETKSTINSFLTAFLTVLKEQFSNQAVAGSLALGGAAIITSIGWKIINYIKKEIVKRLFTIYIIPKGTIQYQYLLSWLKKQPKSSTNVMEVLLGNIPGSFGQPNLQYGGGFFGGGGALAQKGQQNDNEKDEKEDLAIVPGLGASLFIQYSGSYLWISTGSSAVAEYEDMIPFGRRNEGIPQKTVESFPSITTFGPKNDLIRKILREGRKIEIENSNKFTTIFATSTDYNYGNGLNWRVVAHRPARKLESIILPDNQAQSLAADCKEFIQSEQWYTDRGIPYRRGYLLHGKPGCGKTSLVTAIAGSLKLNVYILSLASPGLNDTNLLELLNSIPPHTILLMEDIDSVFKTALTESKLDLVEDSSKQDTNSNVDSEEQGMFGGFGSMQQFGGGNNGGFGGINRINNNNNNNNSNRMLQNQTTRLTFAGILNALDGIAAQTGRLLFMTTNHKERLDPALIRPGRIDYQLEFGEATKEQVRSLFINFYRSIVLANDGVEEEDVISIKYHTAIEKVEKLGTEFSNKVPDRVYTMSQIQGVFMMHRQDPQAVVDTVEDELANLDTNFDLMPPVPSLSLQISSTIQNTNQAIKTSQINQSKQFVSNFPSS